PDLSKRMRSHMDQQGISLQPLLMPGAVTSFYAYEGGPARNAVMAALALQLAGTQDAAPVLVIDWDLEAPALHRQFALPAAEPFAPLSAPAQPLPQFPSPQRLPFFPPLFTPRSGAQASIDDTDEQARPGLLEFFEACRARLRGTAGRGEELAERVIDAVGW